MKTENIHGMLIGLTVKKKSLELCSIEDSVTQKKICFGLLEENGKSKVIVDLFHKVQYSMEL